MALSDLSSAQLQQLIQLVKEKESIRTKLERVNASLAALETGSTPKRASMPSSRTPRRRRRRKNLKDGLLEALGAAGKDGLSIKELAGELKANPQSVNAWFYTTGKKVKGIKKVGRARFAYSAE